MHSEKLNGVVLKELQAAGRQGGLAGIEIIDGVVLADEEWTAANVSHFSSPSIDYQWLTTYKGMTTAAQKINRKGILKKYQKEVAKAYGDDK